MQATSHKQPMDLPIGLDCPQSAFIEEVNDEDIFLPSSSPQLIGHTTVQHVNDPDFINSHKPSITPAPLPPNDLNIYISASNSDNDSLQFLGDPEPKFFGKMTPPSISLIGVAAVRVCPIQCLSNHYQPKPYPLSKLTLSSELR